MNHKRKKRRGASSCGLCKPHKKCRGNSAQHLRKKDIINQTKGAEQD